jgi:hypothetical protein
VTTCASCSTPVTGRWCGHCGEKTVEPRDLTLRGIWDDVVSDVFQYDGRIWRTVRDLIAHPGALTLAWREGRRGRYVKPFSFFLAVNVFFFFLLPDGFWRWDYDEFYVAGGSDYWTRTLDEIRAARGESEAVFKARFNMLASAARQSLLLLGVPIMALAVGLMQWRRRAGAAVHLIFAVHAWAWYLLWWILGWQAITSGLLWIGAGMAVWVAFAFRRVYGDAATWAVVKALGFVAVLFEFQPLLRSVVGLVAMWQVR